jgi:hypothetical protein
MVEGNVFLDRTLQELKGRSDTLKTSALIVKGSKLA